MSAEVLRRAASLMAVDAVDECDLSDQPFWTAVADWLEESAEHLEVHADLSDAQVLREHICPTALEGPECSVLGQAITVARAYLGESQ